jgi:hypothetical protein
VACAGLLCCYVRLSGTFPVGSDGASNALEAWDMLHGNLLLHGWTLTDVSFYTTELPEYALVEVVRGLGPDVVNIASAITYTLLALLAAVLAKGRASGREGAVRALVAAGIMLAPQLGSGIHVVLSQSDHIGTQVPILLIFLLLDRLPGRWYTTPAIGLLLALVVLADQVAIFDAAVPLAVVGGLRAIRLRPASWHLIPWRLDFWKQWLGLPWHEISLVAAAAAGIVAGEEGSRLISRYGGYTLLPVQTGTATVSQLPGHLWLAVTGVLNLFGGDVTGAPPGAQTAIAWLHLAGVTLAVAGFRVAWRGFFDSDDLIPGLLAVGIAVNLAAYVASVIPNTAFETREIAAVLPFGAVLAGRLLGGPLARARSRLVLPALCVAGGCHLAALGYGVAQPPSGNPEQPLASWLVAHRLTGGLGTFTDANIVTLDSGGAVRLRAAAWWARGAVPRLYQSSAAWYDPGGNTANFVVTGNVDSPADLVPGKDILALAGPPARVFHVTGFTVLVWDKNLLPLLGSPPSRWPGAIGHT